MPAARKVGMSDKLRHNRTISASTAASSGDDDAGHAVNAETTETRDPFPSRLVIRNTFLEFADEEAEDLRTRRCFSAPGSPRATPKQAACVPLVPFSNLKSSSVTLSSKNASATFGSGSVAPEMQTVQAAPPVMYSQDPPAAETGGRRDGWQPDDQAAGPMIPTIGSLFHGEGRCKPCAFAWRDKGCLSGVDCVFCHLCDPDERKRRLKAKKASQRWVRGGGQPFRGQRGAPQGW